eukprot:TRINITY_DN16248_c0_g1_i1.p1 TRINITY_DN16248_c0_g1~~TRINITY_DN16248_c0_g1_i1.p1  ORF type:complete len:424 (-),score=72.69 TRINITY_DN16248_c0_g1_i1:211-1452(-)
MLCFLLIGKEQGRHRRREGACKHMWCSCTCIEKTDTNVEDASGESLPVVLVKEEGEGDEATGGQKEQTSKGKDPLTALPIPPAAGTGASKDKLKEESSAPEDLSREVTREPNSEPSCGPTTTLVTSPTSPTAAQTGASTPGSPLADDSLPASAGKQTSQTSLCSVSSLPRRSPSRKNDCWDSVDVTQMVVRGPSYLSDSKKVTSPPAMLELLECHYFLVSPATAAAAGSSSSSCSCVANYASQHARPGNAVGRIRQSGDNRFLFIKNYLIDPYQVVVVWAVPEGADWHNSSPGKLWSKFLKMSTEERNNRLKVIPRIIEAPWLLKMAIPEKPGLVGKKVAITYYQDSDYLEASVNVISSFVGRQTLKVMLRYAKLFSVEVGITIEAQSTEELPERVLCGFSNLKVDMESLTAW